MAVIKNSKLTDSKDTVDALTWAAKQNAENFGVGQAWFSDLSAMGYSDGNLWHSLGRKTIPLPVIDYSEPLTVTNIADRAWTFSIASGGASELSGLHAKESANSIYLMTPAVGSLHSYANSVLSAPIDLSTYDYIEINVFSDGYDYNSSTWCRLFFFTSNPGTTDSLEVAVEIKKPGWNTLRIAKSAFTTYVGGTWANINQLRFRTSSSTNGVRSVYLGSIKAVKASTRRSIVSLGFDDGNASQLYAAVQAAARGIPCTFYLWRSKVGTAGYLTEAEISKIQRMGHETAFHGPGSNNNWPEEIAAVGYDVFAQRVLDDTAYFKNLGVDCELASYPQGLYDAMITTVDGGNIHAALKAAGIKYVRGTNNYGTETINHGHYSALYPKSGMYLAGGVSLNSTVSLATAKAQVDNAILEGRWIQPYGHALADSIVANGITWTKQEYLDYLDYLVVKRNAGLIDVRPTGEVARELTGDGIITVGIED